MRIFFKLSDLCFGDLMMVYEEGNRENSEESYPGLDKNAALIKVEQNFYTFLHDIFFTTQDAFYAVWEENGQYISALRMEPYQDGLLLEALETRPGLRGQGYAKKLVNGVLSEIRGKVYAHVHKQNVASLTVHYACGFRKISDMATYIDGTPAPWCLTLCWDSKIV